ncbi:hypothetical protein SAMN05421676_108109 [Salinibacillus kushneri]|uniref:Lipoprotein n=1 Tax=Salinibacillus kushneri TaxID=237682 RepID=A0A1I0HAV3_9BACI|nr:hypothetical protein [Salinibacillus kushneri]SET80046.1 hypothetical protein SAMN05421676_108109 [Salinibacillus kushneri]
MKNFKRMLPLFLLVALLFVTACSSDTGSNSTPKDKNISTLKTVLEHTFTGPDEKLNELLVPENVQNIGDDGEEVKTEEPNELEKYVEELYKPLFTEDMFNEYVGTYALSYNITENQMKVNDITVEQSETNKNIYDFTAKVEYQGTETKVYDVEGQANFSDEGKISELKFYTDNGLSEALIGN